LKIQELVRRLTEHLLTLGLAVTLAAACKAQEFVPPPAPSSQDVLSNLPPASNQAPALGTPVLEPSGGTTPTATALPEQVPVTAAPSPDAESGGMMRFGGMGGMDAFGGGMFPVDSVRYSAIWYPSVPVQGQAGDFQMGGQDLSFTHPLWVDSLNALSFSGGVRNDLIATEAVLPDTGQAIPSDLWNVHMGLRYSRQLDDGWMTGGGISIESASDHPFGAVGEMNVGANAMLKVPQGEHNAWIFSLMYSPTSELNFPLPMVAFSYNPSPQFHANIGLPLIVIWRPTDQWQFQASYMLIHTIHLKAQYRFAEHLCAFAAYDWSNEAYTLLDRPDPHDRFFIYDQRVSLGLQLAFARGWTASLAGGYVFDRYMFEGTSFASSGSNQVNLGDGPFAALNLGVRF